ncbi:MAG: flagellar export chaperone FlgN [Lachnospiraceae bacterium]|nr:flagellar export chaperone FlgN [Lachnospiraceae bacterium]
MTENDYVTALKQGLSKKVDILKALSVLNEEQKSLLENPELDPDDLEKNIQTKAELVDALSLLDDGFEQVYERLKEELSTNRDSYTADIGEMQQFIKQIMALSASVQSQEQRNKALMEQKFAHVRKQIRGVKNSRTAVQSYYQTMMKVNYIDPQFMDDKK